MNVVNETKKLLSSQFEMKEMGKADVILGIKIRKADDVFLCVSLITVRRC